VAYRPAFMAGRFFLPGKISLGESFLLGCSLRGMISAPGLNILLEFRRRTATLDPLRFSFSRFVGFRR
jgi:hypothetical protein